MNEKPCCPSCGRPLGPGALAGLCPACLLAQGAETETAGPGTGFAPLPLGKVAELFPQLEIIGLLGAGGMGAVYKARQRELDRLVALKILPPSAAGGPNFEERFNREARALARLSHPNIVAVHEFGRVGGYHYFVMEYVDGANLRQLEKASRLSPREALQIIPQICDALQYAHDEGVVHRDIKPENVLVDRKSRVKIADFGLAKVLDEERETMRLTQEGQVMGTPHYMAPEQIERPLAVDHRADIYSLGVVLYEMLTGELPLGKFPPPSRKVEVDVRFDEVVLRALENDPARRYQQASEVKSKIATIGEKPATASLPASQAPQVQFVRWAGFPLVKVSHEQRTVNWLQALFAFVVLFGALTVAFGVVTLASGRSLMGWLGVIGLASVLARLLLAAAFVGWGIRRALLSPKPPATPPSGPTEAVLSPAERFSRKALVGACWAPFFFVASAMMVMPLSVAVGTAVSETAKPPGTYILWWQWLLVITVLVPGVAAPFGTTILGWVAVSDIRRARGRIAGLPLAILDGLLFPLLVLDVFLYLCLASILDSFYRRPMGNFLQSPPYGAVVLGIVGICLFIDFLIVRRVWRELRPGAARLAPSDDWWWNRPSGAIALGVGCLAILLAVARDTEHVMLFTAREDQQALVDKGSGVFAADLPGGIRAELIAIGYPNSAPNQWWRPSGTPITNELWRIENAAGGNFMNATNRELIIQVSGLPDSADTPSLEVNPSTGYVTGGEVFSNNLPVDGARACRILLEAETPEVHMRMGFGLKPWRTIVTHEAQTHSTKFETRPGDPLWNTSFNNVCDTTGGAQVTVVMCAARRDWNRRIIAVDNQGVEHSRSSSQGTPAGDASTWTYTFTGLPLERVAEFRVQVQPVYWVGFANVQLNPNAPLPVPKPVTFGPVRELTFGGYLDFDTGNVREAPVVTTTNGSHGEETRVWLERNGFDAAAGIGELNAFGMLCVALENEHWDTLSPPELTARLHQGMFRPSSLKPWKNGELPSTFGFRTREGGTGMLQLLGFAQGQPGASVRYKLLKLPVLEDP